MFHVAIIMDGNGRWAKARRMPRLFGHHQGAEAVNRVVTAAPALGITDLTVYAFSSDNWRRPAVEVAGLMHLLSDFLHGEIHRCIENGVRVSAIGRRDRIPDFARQAVEMAEETTADQSRLHLRIAVDYSSREAIQSGLLLPEVDLLIRTSGEQRLSDFLLWESAYAELYFTSRLWPDFTGQDLAGAVREFRSRERRFGGVLGDLSEIPA